jgi:hypothetical protein
MRSLAISLVVLASLACGCGSRDGDVKRSEPAGQSQPDEQPRTAERSQFDCPGGLTRPFSVETLIQVAQEEGVSLKRDPGCGGNLEYVAAAANMVISDGATDDDEVDAREGHVMCHLADQPFAAAPFRVRRTKYPDDQETYFHIANVHCAIYPTGAGQVSRLEAALRALAAAPVEQRSCPQARPKPVTVAGLIEAAKKNGLRLLRDARCIEPGVVAQASTIVPYDRPANVDEVFYDQGEVTCLVREAAMLGADDIETTDLSVGKRFDFLNLSCTVEPSLGEETAQVERVRATLREFS